MSLAIFASVGLEPVALALAGGLAARELSLLFWVSALAVEVTEQNPGEPLEQRGCGLRDVLLRESPCGFIGVRAHLLDTLPATDGPHQDGPCLGVTVTGPGLFPV